MGIRRGSSMKSTSVKTAINITAASIASIDLAVQTIYLRKIKDEGEYRFNSRRGRWIPPLFASLERLTTDGSKKAFFWPSAVGGLWHFSPAWPGAGPKKACQQGVIFWSQLTGRIFSCPSYGGQLPKKVFFGKFRARALQKSKNQDLRPPQYFCTEETRVKILCFNHFLVILAIPRISDATNLTWLSFTVKK